MSQTVNELFLQLLRCGLFLSLGAALILLLRTSHRYPRLTRALWIGVLVQGVFVFHLQVSASWIPDGLHAETGDVARPGDSTQNTFELADYGTSTRVEKLTPLTTLKPSVSATTDRGNRHELSILKLAACCWALGLMFLVGWQIFVYRRFIHRIRYVDTPTEWQDEWRAETAGEKSCFDVRIQATASTGPLVCRRPKAHIFLVPHEQWSTLNADQRIVIMQHEIQHLKRRDTIKALLVRLLALPQWFNPFAWIAVREFEKCAEFACDDALRNKRPELMVEYARTLLELGQSNPNHLLLASSASGHPLVERIQRILPSQRKDDRSMKFRLTIAVLTVIALSGSNTLRLAHAQDSPSAESADDQTPVADVPKPLIATDTDNAETVGMYDALDMPGTEAVVDIARLFKSSARFRKLRGELQVQIKKNDAELRKLVVLYQSQVVSDPTKSAELEAEILTQRNDARERLAEEESRIYLEVFQEIQREVSLYAREHGIRVVRRATTQPFIGSIEKAERKMSPQEVIAFMNRPIIFSIDQPRDITEEVLERLKKQELERPAERAAGTTLSNPVVPATNTTPSEDGTSARGKSDDSSESTESDKSVK